jgi:hypothetical protein
MNSFQEESMKKGRYIAAVAAALIIMSGAGFAGVDVANVPITRENMAFLPVPEDYKTYYILQSIEDVTVVVIADFAGTEKKICLITDKNSDGTIDTVWEYYPDSKQYARPDKPTTSLFTSYPQIKNDIIEGKVFAKIEAGSNAYTHVMASLPELKVKLREGRVVTRWGHDGRYVRIVDPDTSQTTMADFYFGKESGVYSLQFRTNYYKRAGTKIEPTIKYSVYSRRSKDPVIKEYVEALLKQAKEKHL